MKTAMKPHLMTCMRVLLNEIARLLCCWGFDWVAMGWASAE
jgi:hypothetical protein